MSMRPVYCQHFGLKREPFSVTPDPSFLYRTDSHEEALAQLVYGIQARRGFVVLTGEVGTGKTTLIRSLLDELNPTTKTALIFHIIVKPKDLLRYVCEKFGLVTDDGREREVYDYIRLLETFLTDSYRNGLNVALIIDEAQNLSTEVLENVRLLSNFENSEHKLLQIVLVGQPELGLRLNEPEMRQIRQRVALRHHLSPLDLAQCKQYVLHRLTLAGGSENLFSADAFAVIHHYSGGIPRVINILCDNALLAAYGLRQGCVDALMVRDVARDLQLAWENGSGETGRPVPLEQGLDHSGNREVRQSRRSTKPSVLVSDQNERPANGRMLSDSGALTTHLSSVGELETGPTAITGPHRQIVPSPIVERIIHALTQAMGPMAPWIVRDHVAQMGESIDAFPVGRLEQLIERTSNEILTKRLKIRYQRLMAGEIAKIENYEDAI